MKRPNANNARASFLCVLNYVSYPDSASYKAEADDAFQQFGIGHDHEDVQGRKVGKSAEDIRSRH